MASDWCNYIGCGLTVYVLAVLAYKIFQGIWTTWLGSALGFGYKLSPGPKAFAVITGATDGIGLEYAHYFAKKGYNLLLVSRTLKKLEDAKEEIQNKNRSIEIQICQADFTRTDIYDHIKSQLLQLPRIEVLVNNVGMSYEYAEYLSLLPESSKTLQQLIDVNITSTTQMMSLVLPLMSAQKKGLILNLSSFSASCPSPLLSVYGAAKTYVDFLSRAVQVEYKRDNIVIQSILPAYVSTKMSKIRKASLMVPSPTTYVAAQMRTVGLEDRTYGYWTHKLQGFVMDNLVPLVAGKSAASYITYRSLLGVRAKVYKKKGLGAKEK